MPKRITLICLIFLLTACTSVGKYNTDRKALNYADLHFVGLPGLVGAVGSSFPVSPDFSITAKHVAKVMLVKVKAYHPICDIAIIYHDNHNIKNFPTFQDASIKQDITIYGYNAYTILPTSGTGKITQFGYFTGKSDSCWIAATSAGAVAGMSGGPVLTADGQIVGVIFGVNQRLKVSLIVPYQTVNGWIKENIK